MSNPFSHSKFITLKDAGQSFTGRADRVVEVQARDFQTQKPALWPDGNPKMVKEITVTLPDGTTGRWQPPLSAHKALEVFYDKTGGLGFWFVATRVTQQGERTADNRKFAAVVVNVLAAEEPPDSQAQPYVEDLDIPVAEEAPDPNDPAPGF